MLRERKILFKTVRFCLFSLFLILVSFFFLDKLTLAASVTYDDNKTSVLKYNEYVFGNSPENINFSGWIGSDGEYIYYSQENQYLMKKSLNGDAKPITLGKKRRITFINVTEDWVFYTAEGNTLMRVRKDGSGEEKIDNADQGVYTRVLVVDNHIFCIKNRCVYRIELDGSNEGRILEVAINCFAYSSGALYFIAEDMNSEDKNGIWKYQLDTEKVVKISNVAMRLPVLIDDTFYYTTWDTQMDKYGLFCMSLNDLEPKRITSDYQYCLNQYKGMLIVVDEENRVYQISTDFTKRKRLGTGYGNHVIGDELYCTNFEHDTQYAIKLSDNTDGFEDVTITDIASDIDKINNTDYQIQIEEENQVIAVGPYNVQINEDGKTFTLFSAFVNAYKAICPDSLTLPSVLKVNGQEYQINAISDGFIMESNVIELIVPEGILSIGGDFCTDTSSLESLSLPASVTRIGYPFIGMWNLNEKFKELKIADGNKYFKMVDGAMYSYDGGTLIRAPFAAGEYIVVSGVNTIAAGCFYENCMITKVTVPDGVTYIGPYAFFECEKSLDEVVLPNSVGNIGEKAFGFCLKLKVINLPKSLTKITAGCFMYTSVKEVIIPEGVTKIEESAFFHCYHMEKLSLPSTFKEISNSAFQIDDIWKDDVRSCMTPEKVSISPKNPYFKIIDGGLLSKDGTIFYFLLTSDSTYTVPSTVKTIKKSAFCTHTQAKKVFIPKGITYIPEYAFANSWIEEVVLPNTITTIGQSAFESSRLCKINLPKGLKVIGKYAFLNSNLNEITIPSTVTKIMEKAFTKEGGKLTMIFLGKNPPATLMRQTEHPENEGISLTIYVPKTSIKAYKKAFAVNHKGALYTIEAIK